MLTISNSVRKISVILIGLIVCAGLLVPHATVVHATDHPSSASGAPADTDGDPMGTVEGAVYTMVVGVFGRTAYAGAMVMNAAMDHFVREYATMYLETFGGAVENLWAAVRDLINLTLIFGLIYIGFRFILDSDDSGAKRNLVTLIIAAILVNFSLFFAKGIVDISHVAAVSFEDSITQNLDDNTGGVGDISGAFANVLNLTTVFENTDQERAAPAPSEATGTFWGLIIMTALVLLVATFVFAALGVLLTIRFIVLTFMLIFSPIMVLGMIFPNLQGLSGRWFRTFLGQAFMAPAIFLTLYASLIILQGIQSQVQGTVTGNSFIDYARLDALPFYILGMGFMIASLIIAQKMGAYGASGTMSVGRNLVGRSKQYAKRAAYSTARTTGRGAAAGTGAALRNTRGRAALKQIASHKDPHSGITLSDQELKKAQAAADSSYDPRMIGAWMKDKSMLKVQKGGAQKEQDEQMKKFDKYQDSMGELDVAKVARMSDAELQKLEKDKGITGLAKRVESLQSTEMDIVRIEEDMKGLSGDALKAKQNELKQKQKELKAKQTSIKFARQLAELEKRESAIRKEEENTPRNKKTSVGRIGATYGAMAGAGTMLAGASLLTGGLAAGAVAGGASIYQASAYRAQEQERRVTEQQRRRYGANGEKMLKHKEQKELAKNIAENQKELGEVPSADSNESDASTT